MKYVKIANSALEVSKICLGTMTWGKQNTEADGHAQMSYAVEQGINFFDTAEMYAIPPSRETYGSTEKIIGSWFKKTGLRDKIVLASKIAGKASFTKHIRDETFTNQSIVDAVEASLVRLGTDRIDLYQLHWPERRTNYFGQRGYKHDFVDPWQDNFAQILETLNTLIQQGKIRYIGLSNETPWGVMRYLDESKVNELSRMVTIQNPYSLLNRSFETGLAEVAIRENIKLLAYSPLAFGVLSGKYMNGSPENARLTLFPHYDRYNNPQAKIAVQKYAELAAEFNMTLAQMSLAFVNQQPFLASNIIGATSIEQLEENISSVNIQLPADLIEKIEQVHNLIPDPSP